MRFPDFVASGVLLLALGGQALMASTAQAQEPGPLRDVVVTGTLHDSDRASYRELPFTVPANVGKITVRLEGNDPATGTYLVLGVYDTERLRGWGGAIKPEVTIARTFASSSYLPGPLPAGQWHASVRVASIRDGASAPYRLVVHFERGAEAQSLYEAPVRPEPGWYRGDFHTHTGQSDGKCRSQPSGKPVPCPVLRTLEAAYAHGLDFISVSDHNVAAQDAELAADAAYFDTMLVIPGREMTTAQGHFNLTGITDYVDFRLGAPGPRDINAMVLAARPTGALVSINHPEIPTGENCLGCGWSAGDTDFSRVDAIEVANGGIAAEAQGRFDDGVGSGTQWWETLLSRGFHLTGIGGSDNHDPIDGRAGFSPVGAQSPVGIPATAVEARELSQAAVIAGVRAGRVFIDLTGANPVHAFDIAAHTARGAQATMGGTLILAARDTVSGTIWVGGLDGTHVDLILDGRHLPLGAAGTVQGEEAQVPFAFTARDLGKGQIGHWLRADVRDAQGRRLLIGNPIYLELAK